MDAYIIEDVKTRYDCRQVIGHDLGPPKSKSGKWQSWPCPFHSEQTPGGFQVTKDGYKCFSCGATGDILTWRMKHHGETFVEAIEAMNGGRVFEKDPKKAAEQAARRAEQAARELERKIQEAQKALTELHQAQAWLRYHDQLTDEARRTWESWGIPEFWQGYWKLGFDPDHIVWTGSEEWHTPTMTIPIFEPATWSVLNIKHRLMKPYRPGDKYRPERSGLPQAAWIAEPDNKLEGRTLIVEGEKKAMVSYLTADDSHLQVVGLPGKNPRPEIVEQMRNCDPVYICLDPDATVESYGIAAQLGTGRCRVIELPDKIDDMILRYHLDKSWMRGLMRTARKV